MDPKARERFIPGPVVPSGDFGLGLCLQCLGQVIAHPDKAPQPRLACTLAPMLYPPGAPVGLIAVPACWECLKGGLGKGSGLVAARGLLG